jgi:putative aldouronate transport system substrate-binding protein
MKKTLRIVSLLTVLALAAASLLPGCASPATTQAPTQPPQAATDAATFAPTPEPAAEPYTLKVPVFDRAKPELPPVDDNYWTKWVQDNFGTPNNITIEYVPILRTDTMGTYNTLIAAQDSPDILMEYDYPKLMAFYAMGALQEIPDGLLNQYAPNFRQFIGEDILNYGMVEGKRMMVCARRPVAYNYMTMIRQDWLDQVGMTVPTDREAYVAALQAFKDKGLGIPSTLYMPQAYYGAYGFRDYPLSEEDLALYSDVNVCALTWAPVKENLKFQNDLYNRGLISPEFYLDLDGNKAQADFTAGNAGTYNMYLAVNPPVLQTLLQNVPTAKVAYLPRSAGFPKGAAVTDRLYWNFGMLEGISVSCKHPEGVLKLLDWMCGKDALFTLQNGIEGKQYDLADGLPVAKEYDGEERFNYNSNKDMWCLVIEGKDYGSEDANLKVQKNTFAPPGFDYLIQSGYEDYVACEKTMYPDFLFDKALESASENANLQAKWQELYTKLITCKPADFETTYAAACQEYLDTGYQKVLDEKKQVYDAMKGQ